MGDDRSTNAIPTGLWVRRELVDALREALPDSYRPGMYVALHDAARAVVDAVETEDEPKMPMTDLPDAVVEAAAEAFARKRNPKHKTLDHSETLAIRAALAAASGLWAEQLDAAKAEADGQRLAAQILAEETQKARDDRDAALARNAELEHELYGTKDSLKVVGDLRACYRAERDALRAELDNLRETLAQKVEAEMRRLQTGSEAPEFDEGMAVAAAIVRGSDDE